jgi:hypothetical protein
MHFLAAEVYLDDLPLTFEPIFQASGVVGLKFTALAITGEYPNSDGVLQQGRELILMRPSISTAEWLMMEFGSVNPGMYTWGERHGSGFGNGFGGPLDGGWVATHGGEDTVNVSGSNFFTAAPDDVVPRFESTDGPVFRVVTQFEEDGTPEAVHELPARQQRRAVQPALGRYARGLAQRRVHEVPLHPRRGRGGHRISIRARALIRGPVQKDRFPRSDPRPARRPATPPHAPRPFTQRPDSHAPPRDESGALPGPALAGVDVDEFADG